MTLRRCIDVTSLFALQKTDPNTTENVLKWFYSWGAEYLIHRGAPFLTEHGPDPLIQRTSLMDTLRKSYWHFYAADGGMREVYVCYRDCLNSRRTQWSASSSGFNNGDSAQESAAFTAISNAAHVEFSWACRVRVLDGTITILHRVGFTVYSTFAV